MMARRLVIGVVAVSLLAGVLGTVAHAQPYVGEIRFSISPTSLSFPPTEQYKQIFESFTVTNNTECGITLRHRSAGNRAFSSFCTGFTNLGEILPGKFVGCRGYFKPYDKGRLKGRIMLTFGYGYSCREFVRKQVLAVYQPKVDTAIRRRDEHNDKGPNYAPLDEAHKREGVRVRERLVTLRAKERELRFQRPEVDRLTQRREQWRLRVKARERKLMNRLKDMKTKGVDMSAVNNVLAQMQQQGSREIAKAQADASSKCSLVAQLKAERDAALAEMRAGQFCAACKRPPSRIRRETKETFRQHIRRVGKGTIRATPAMLAKERDAWQRKIDPAVRNCNNARPRAERLRKQWQAKYERVRQRAEKLKERHRTRLGRLVTHIRELKKRWKLRDKELTDKIDAADAARLKRLADTRAQIRKTEDGWRAAQVAYKRARKAVEKAHRKRSEELERLVRTREKERDNALKRALIPLKRTKSAVVNLDGQGQ